MTLIVKMNVQQRCIDLFPAEEWERRSEKVLDGIDPELNAGDAQFWTKYNDGVSTLVPDGKLGRLNIPSELLEQAGITKEVVFGGVGYKLQIWNPETRKASLLSEEEFKKTALRLSERK
jgi:DNA-binding transcriptional regulator/RsmH inhibitor MraZ